MTFSPGRVVTPTDIKGAYHLAWAVGNGLLLLDKMVVL